MRTALAILGNTFIVIGVIGLALLFWGELHPDRAAGAPLGSAAAEPAVGSPVGPAGFFPIPIPLLGRREGPTRPTDGGAGHTSAEAGERRAPQATVAITRVVAPSIQLDAEVVPSDLVLRDGGATWTVPPHRAGHAQGTAGAGQAGTAVLFGHVSSRRDGDVFRHLADTKIGEVVTVFADTARFDYRVVSVDSVPRTDASVLEPTPTPTLALITCTGLWLPTIWDYTERLIVHAELAEGQAT